MGQQTKTNHFYQDFDLECFPSSRPQRADDYRCVFQIDRDRIIYSAPFRRLQSKTQVFQSGEYDFYRTRLTHSIEVAHVGRSICQHINYTSDLITDDFFIDPDLVEGICLAHDLGHPPFGHIGERKLNSLMADHGGFEGNAQTLRIITQLIYDRGGGVLHGMKPTRAFLDGVMKYKSLYNELKIATDPAPRHHFLYDDQIDILTFVCGHPHPTQLHEKSIECQIMDWADDTAYCLHDMIDGVRAHFITPLKLERWAQAHLHQFDAQDLPVLQSTIDSLIEAIRQDHVEWHLGKQIGDFIHAAALQKRPPVGDLSHQTHRHGYDLKIDPLFTQISRLYKTIAFDLIFTSPALQRYEFKGSLLLGKIFQAIYNQYVENPNGLKILSESTSNWIQDAQVSPATRMRRICDYLADLTDRQAIQVYKRLYQPDFGSLTDLG